MLLINKLKSIASHFSIVKLLNVFLRLGGIGSKFLVLILLSKVFDIEVFGNYSLIISLITIFIFVLGLDFYNFSIRDILVTDSEQEIRNKVATLSFFYGLVYLLFIIIASISFNYINYIKPFLYLVILLCISEHLSQEIYRLLIGFEKILLANVLLFIRTMGWAVVVFYYVFYKIPFNIEFVFKLWLSANIFTIVYIFILIISRNYLKIRKIKIDFLWIKKGIKVCYLFFISTIFLKIIEYSNRFVVDFYLGKEMAGIFIFYSSISILITVYINTIVISFELPELIKSANSNKIKGLLLKFKKSLITHTIIISITILFLIKPILYWQNKEEFQEYLPLLFFMIIAAGLMNYSLFYHFKLYIFHKDKSLFKIITISGAIGLLVTVVLTYLMGVYGSAIASVFTGILLFYMRYNEVNKLNYD